jgi:hypothetical protein
MTTFALHPSLRGAGRSSVQARRVATPSGRAVSARRFLASASASCSVKSSCVGWSQARRMSRERRSWVSRVAFSPVRSHGYAPVRCLVWMSNWLVVAENSLEAVNAALAAHELQGEVIRRWVEEAGDVVTLEVWGMDPVRAPPGLSRARRRTDRRLQWIASRHEATLMRHRLEVLQHPGMPPARLPERGSG